MPVNILIVRKNLLILLKISSSFIDVEDIKSDIDKDKLEKYEETSDYSVIITSCLNMSDEDIIEAMSKLGIFPLDNSLNKVVNYSENVDKIASFLNIKLGNRFQTNMNIRSLFASAKKL